MEKIKYLSIEEIKEKNEFIKKQKDAFYLKYPERVWKEYVHSDAEMTKIRVALNFLINTQNGQDLDDGIIRDRFLNLGTEFIGKDVLIVGSGTGREVNFALNKGALSVCGITMGKRNNLFAREVMGIEQIIVDMHMLPFSNEKFGIITGFQVLEHAYAPIIFLLECNRVLKTGGIFYVETPPSKTHSMDSWLHHIMCPTPRQMFCLLLKSGFKPLEFNEIDISGLKVGDDFEWLDDTSLGVYFKAEKMDPYTYERGDMRRYYEMLDGSEYKY